MKRLKLVPGDIDEEFDESIYVEQTRERLLDDDELSPEEAAFMDGYDEAG